MNHIEWGEGPWNNEDDHVAWVDSITGLDCMVNRGPSGALCGYVGVGPDHPYHGKDYNDVDVEVHGGLTYSDACQEDGEICHLPEEGREHDIWWFGFDCAHHMDFAPRMEADLRKLNIEHPSSFTFPDEWKKVYRDWAYVTGECRDLAWQLVQVRA